MTVQLESQRLWDPAARSKSELRDERWEHAEAQVREMVEREDDAALCDLLRETGALSALLGVHLNQLVPSVEQLFVAIVDQRAAEIEEELE